MKRRNFLRGLAAVGLSSALPLGAVAAKGEKTKTKAIPESGVQDREYWANLLYRMAKPILSNMSKGELRKNMNIEVSPTWGGQSKDVAYLEAFGRLLAGLAPWLNLPDDDTAEGKQRSQLRQWTLLSLANSVDPSSPDYLAWNNVEASQPLVDAAFVAHALLRNPDTLWKPLDEQTKQRFITEFKGLRRVRPSYNNWLLFAAMTETFLLSIGEQADLFRIDMAVRKTEEWYAGDGWYADGAVFTMDYYNAYVIHCMLIDILAVFVNKAKRMPSETYAKALKRMQRYAEFLERFISPEGSYPAFGRSITYRVGAFQPLGQLALMEQLPEGVSAAQVRCALTAVMRRMFAAEGNFDSNDFLQLGFVGHQPNIADSYTNTGSLYLTSLGFLPLGLPATHEFWTAPPADWTSKKAWSGQAFKKDYAVKY